jgi:hypothetical protein
MAQVAVAMTDELSPEEVAMIDGQGEGQSVEKETVQPEAKESPVEVKVPEAKTEPADDSGEEIENVPNKGRFVRHGAFHAEREKRKALEKQLTEAQERWARGDERLALLNEALSKPQTAQEKAADPKPDPEQDPFGYMKWQDRQIEALRGEFTKTAQQTTQVTSDMQLRSAYQADAATFAQKTPDFMAAYQFLLQSRDKELELLGHTDPATRQKLIQDEERDLASRSLQARQSAAERIYTLAKARGYATAAPATPALLLAATPAPVNTAAKTASQEIDRINNAQAASKSLSNVGGSAGEALSLEALADMPEDKFAEIVSKMSRPERQRLFGG